MIIVTLGIVAALFVVFTINIYRKFWDYGLTAELAFEQHTIEEGEHFRIKEKVENRKVLPIPTLLLKFQMDRELQCVDQNNTKATDKTYRTDFVSVMPHTRVTRFVEAIGTKRGYYDLNSVQFVATDLLFQKTFIKECENHSQMYVYPARSEFMQLPQIFSTMYGEALANRLLQEDSMEFKGIRDYAQTDPMHRINWKSSARTGSLKVNQYFDSTSERLTIFLNVSQNGVLKYDDLIEESIRIARNFIEEFVHKGIPVRVISNGVDKLTGQEISIQEGAGFAHVDACLKELARMDIKAPARNMIELIYEQKQKETGTFHREEVSLLVSAEQSPELAKAYLEYAGDKGSANWLIPIHASEKKYQSTHVSKERIHGTSGNFIRTEYLVMEELEAR